MKDGIKKLISLILSVTMALKLCACSYENKNDVDKKTNKMKNSINTVDVADSDNSKKSLENYLDNINGVSVTYNHEENYPTNEDIRALMVRATTTTQCDYNFNETVIDLVLELMGNSINYTIQNPEYEIPFMVIGDSIDSELLSMQQNFETTLTAILNEWFENNTNNINEDTCTLKEYSIVFSFSETERENCLAYTNIIDNVIVLFPNRISEFSNNNNCDYFAFFKQIIKHELNHVRGDVCNCRLDKGQLYLNIGNPTLIEASAESEISYTSNFLENTYNYLYVKERESEALLLTLGLFHDDMNIDDYYNAIFDSNLLDFYNFFDVHTTEEINTLYNIFYAINAINLRNDLFFNHYEVSKEISYDDINMFVGFDYKADIFKFVLKNMMEYTYNHEDFSLKDNLVMFNIIKSLIVKDSYYVEETGNENNPYKYIYEEDFVANIYTLEYKYAEFLSEYYSVSLNDIRIMEDDISLPINEVLMYCSNNYTDSDYAVDLVSRFPLLKQILNIHYISSCYYTDFIENTSTQKNNEPKGLYKALN